MGLGLASCIAVLLLTLRFELADPESEPYQLGHRPLLYLPWLLWEIARANLQVARVILSPSLPISPTLVRLKASQQSELCQAIFANSITLTPGTVTIELKDGSLLVHALSEDAAVDLLQGEMDARVMRVER